MKSIALSIEWDENKRKEVYKNRGVDIVYASLIFEGDTLTRLDDRDYDGEKRYISLGMINGEAYVVVHTERDGAIRIITAWKGGRNERKKYEESFS